MKNIAVFTGSRAEYGLLYWIIKGLHESKKINLQLYVGGMHLSHEFGHTIDCINEDGFKINEKIDFLLSSDSPVGITKSMGLALISFADIFQRNSPDLLVILGDRFESMAVCQAAAIAQIPIAHIHGGEITEGAVDEAFRHSITKMSHLHFAATEEYRKRIIQLGKDPKNVHNFGSPGLDNIHNLRLLSRIDLAKVIKFDITTNPYFVVTFHPVTLSKKGAKEDLSELINALKEKIETYSFIITFPNSDAFGKEIITKLHDFQKAHPEKVLFSKSLGQIKYLSALKHSNGVIGNSSSGLIEAPAFKIPTIDIGIRQKGRVSGETVINVEGNSEKIINAINKSQTKKFEFACKSSTNPYGSHGASAKIVKKIESFSNQNIIYKKFHDVL